MAKNRQVAYLFDEAGEMSREKLGGKAMSLVTMTQMGLPVPTGFAVSTGVCRAYLEYARYPRRLQWQIQRCLNILERRNGLRFGDDSNPLLVSVRSGAPVSMPGMMDSILNLGMTEKAVRTLERSHGKSFAHDTYDRFRASFKKVVGSESNDPQEQLQLAFEAICQSWLNDRAVEYRRVHNIPENIGTAMIVQSMVFGNLDEMSGTGVLFSRNVATGDREIYGEFLVEAQGEDIVGGGVTPLPISVFADLHPEAFKQLTEWASILEKKESDVVEIEFTIQAKRLWVLQYRVAKRAPIAAARFGVQLVWDKKITKTKALARVSEVMVEQIGHQEFCKNAIALAKANNLILESGLPASPGAAFGIAVFSSKRAQELTKEGKSVVLIRPETNPDDFAGMLVSSAIVTQRGGATSHAAVVARGLGIPAVVGVGGNLDIDIMEGDPVSVDGTRGLVFYGQLPFVSGTYHKETSIFLKWVEQARPRGVVNFSTVKCQYSANVILNDFYLSDGMARMVQETKLAEKAKALRNCIHRETAELFATYLLLAIAGELRHGWDGPSLGSNRWRRPVFDELEKDFDLLRAKNDHKFRREAQEAVIDRLSASPHQNRVRFAKLAVAGFNSWSGSSAVGGSKWASIAEAVQGYLEGKLNNSVFVDRVFDLRHNGERLFDKHQMFNSTNETRIQIQLCHKKHQKDIDGLVRELSHTCNCDIMKSGHVSLKVRELWYEGRGKYWGFEKIAEDR